MPTKYAILIVFCGMFSFCFVKAQNNVLNCKTNALTTLIGQNNYTVEATADILTGRFPWGHTQQYIPLTAGISDYRANGQG